MSDKVVSQGFEKSGWWGEFEPEIGLAVNWSIGPLLFAVRRREKEWQVYHHSGDWPDDTPSAWTITEGEDIVCCDGAFQRHVFADTSGELVIEPLLADRSVVIKSTVPILIPAGEQISFYVSTPLWLQAKLPLRKHVLLDVATIRLSDTWFGPSTMEGELCYATTTSGRLYLDDLPVRAHRAITPVKIKNSGEKPLKLEKLSLPVPFLSLFDTSVHGLWTEEIALYHDERKDITDIVVGGHPPEPYNAARRISGPRKTAEKSMLHKTFGALFGA